MLLAPGLDDPGGDDLEPQLRPDFCIADVDQLQLDLVPDILGGRRPRPRLDDAFGMELVAQVVWNEEEHGWPKSANLRSSGGPRIRQTSSGDVGLSRNT